MKTTPSHVRRWRIGAVYAALVVAPAVLAVLLLGGGPGGSAAGSAAGAAHHDSGFARLLVTIAVVVICCKLAGRAAAGIGLPAVVGEIVAGIVLGPSVLGTLWAEAQAWLFPEETVDRLGVLADLGVVLFVFLAGTELNTRMLRRSGLAAVMVSHVGIALPLAGGVLLAFASSSVFAAEGASFPAFALFVGVAMSISALPVLARLLGDAGVQHTRLAAIALSSALIDDVTAWCLLALVVAMAGTGSFAAVALVLALVGGFVAVLLGLLRPLLARVLDRPWMRRGRFATTVVVVLVLLCSVATETIGVHAIFGAFLLGMILPRDHPVVEETRSAVEGLTGVLLLPVFFAVTGLRTELDALLLAPHLWGWLLVFLVVAFTGKLGGAALAARVSGETWEQAARIGLLMNCRGLTELIVLNVGLGLGLITGDLFGVMVLVALVSTVLTAPAVRFRGGRSRERDEPEGRAGPEVVRPRTPADDGAVGPAAEPPSDVSLTPAP